MIQISFEPSLDPYHTIFRLIRLLPIVSFAGRLEVDHIRILDFYLLFPFRIASIRMKRDHTKLKKVVKAFEKHKPYGEMPEDQVFFNRMRPIQITALQHLAACNLIDPEQFEAGWIVPSQNELPKDLAVRAHDANNKNEMLMKILKVLALDYSFSGSGGLKERTNLLEHRYDAA